MTPSLSNDYFQTLGGISSKEKTEIIVLISPINSSELAGFILSIIVYNVFITIPL